MGRRKRRKEQRQRPIRRLPSIFLCPRCSRQALSISIKKKLGSDEAVAHALCGECGLCATFKVPAIFQQVDAYGKLVDLYDELVDVFEELVARSDCYRETGVEEAGD